MKANPGGNLPPDQVYGRDRFIEMLLDRLESQSVVINAERRIGKTQILKKMVEEPREGWKPIYKDLERIRTAQEFAELVYDDVQEFLGTTKRAKNFIQKFFEENETKHINLKARTWKQLLVSAVEDLMSGDAENQLVFFWDEMPYMLESIRINRNEGPKVAAEVLDTIRSLRMEQQRFRVVFTGSIGLHHVLEKLTESGIPTSAKNDMFHTTVTPLEPHFAKELATDLLKGEKIQCESYVDAASAIAKEVDCFPFYIHHVIAGLKIEQLPATPQNVRDFVAEQLVSASDPWQLAHFRTRLSTYYPDGVDANSVTKILDAIAIGDGKAFSVDELSSQMVDLSRDDLLRLLRLLDADHYLSRQSNGSYSFRFPLIRRWWRMDRGL